MATHGREEKIMDYLGKESLRILSQDLEPRREVRYKHELRVMGLRYYVWYSRLVADLLQVRRQGLRCM